MIPSPIDSAFSDHSVLAGARRLIGRIDGTAAVGRCTGRQRPQVGAKAFLATTVRASADSHAGNCRPADRSARSSQIRDQMNIFMSPERLEPAHFSVRHHAYPQIWTKNVPVPLFHRVKRIIPFLGNWWMSRPIRHTNGSAYGITPKAQLIHQPGFGYLGIGVSKGEPSCFLMDQMICSRIRAIPTFSYLSTSSCTG